MSVAPVRSKIAFAFLVQLDSSQCTLSRIPPASDASFVALRIPESPCQSGHRLCRRSCRPHQCRSEQPQSVRRRQVGQHRESPAYQYRPPSPELRQSRRPWSPRRLYLRALWCSSLPRSPWYLCCRQTTLNYRYCGSPRSAAHQLFNIRLTLINAEYGRILACHKIIPSFPNGKNRSML